MSIVLQADPYNLQGSSGAGLQPAGSPQQAYGPVPPVAPLTPAPVATAPKPAASVPPVTAAASVPKLDATGLVGASFSPYIGARPSPYNPSVAEFYRKDTGQALDQAGLFSYASSLGLGAINSFDQLKASPAIPTGTGFGAASTPAQTPTDPNQALAQAAARAGLNLDDYLKLSSPTVTPEEKQQIYDKYGISQLEQSVFTPPSKTTEQIYQDAFNQAGLGDLKAKIADLDSRIAAIKQKYIDKQGTINENPFLSEASRTGRLKNLTDQGNAEIGNLIDEQQQYADLYNSGINEVNNLVTRTTADFNSNQTFNAQKLQYLQSKAEKDIADLQSSKSSQAYTYLPDYLRAKAQATKPDTIGSAESGYYRWNPDTGTFEQVIAPTVIPNYQANPLTGELFDTKTGLGAGGSGGSAGGSVAIPQNTLAYRNNNPGNLRYAGQEGATQGEGGFAKFSTPEAGYQALIAQIQLDAGRGATLSSFINKYAPPSENNTSQYIQQAIAATGASANTPLSQIDLNTLAQFMAKKESGTTISSAQSGGIIDNLVQQVISNPALLTQLPDVQQKAVVARMAQLGYSIPNTKQATDAQNQSSAYATRVQQSGQILDQLESSIADYNIVGFKAQQIAPNNLKSSTIQQYEQAARNFINAILRRESGAAIAQSEFDNAYQQYLPYPGDSPQVLKQKKANRDAVLNGLVQSAGPAYGGSGLQMPNGSPSSGANLSDLNFSF